MNEVVNDSWLIWHIKNRTTLIITSSHGWVMNVSSWMRTIYIWIYKFLLYYFEMCGGNYFFFPTMVTIRLFTLVLDYLLYKSFLCMCIAFYTKNGKFSLFSNFRNNKFSFLFFFYIYDKWIKIVFLEDCPRIYL